jgi:hypothetical protein
MNPDLFITIAFGFYAALIATGAGAVALVMVSRRRRTDASPDLPASALRAHSSATGADVFATPDVAGVRIGSPGAEATTRRVASLGANATIASTFALIGVMLVAVALVAAFLLHPPLLGWIGFAVVCAIVFGLATVATIASSRMRVNPQRPAVAPDGEPRLLVVADEHCGSPALWQEIYARLAGAVAVHLVVPVRVSHLHYLTNDEAEEFCSAEDRVRLAVGLLHQRGISVTGGVGSDDPLESMTDALGSFAATRVLLATSTEQDSYWMEHELLAKARAITPLEVSHVVVPPTRSGGNGQRLARR